MSKKLVAFFSASGTTKKVAQMIAEEAKADLFEIEDVYKRQMWHRGKRRGIFL